MIVQIGSYGASGVMSNALTGLEEITMPLCGKPVDFTPENQKAWCEEGMERNIQKNKETWNWTCGLGKKIKHCTFTETKSYHTRGGVYFSHT